MPGRFQGDLPQRTFEFGASILDGADSIPRNMKGWIVARQLLRSGTSVGANVREASQAQTDAEFIQRCSIARKEASESHYWLMLCERCRLLPAELASRLSQEANELTSILSTIVRKSQARRQSAGKK
jgi:four helix bundle protein